MVLTKIDAKIENDVDLAQLHSTGLKKYQHINPSFGKDFAVAGEKKNSALNFKGDSSTQSLQAFLSKGMNPFGAN